MKQEQRGFGRVAVPVAVLVIAGLGVAGWSLLHISHGSTKQPASNSKNAAASTATIKGVQINKSDYYSLTLSTADASAVKQYYGKVQKIGNAYVRLYPAYYTTSAGTLVLLGKELHAPEPVMYVKANKIAAFARLAPTDAHLQAIQAYGKSNPIAAVQDAFPSNAIDTYIKPAEFQAVFFDDGRVFFGKLKSASSGQLFTDSSQVFSFQKSGNQVSLAKLPVNALASYNNSQIIFWENLTTTGQVSKAIATYLKQNP